jgi:hypothetical protein
LLLHQQLQQQLETQLVRGSIALGGKQVELKQAAGGSGASAPQQAESGGSGANAVQQVQQDGDDEDEDVVVVEPPAKKPKKAKAQPAPVLCDDCFLVKEARGHICIKD